MSQTFKRDIIWVCVIVPISGFEMYMFHHLITPDSLDKSVAFSTDLQIDLCRRKSNLSTGTGHLKKENKIVRSHAETVFTYQQCYSQSKKETWLNSVLKQN